MADGGWLGGEMGKRRDHEPVRDPRSLDLGNEREGSDGERERER